MREPPQNWLKPMKLKLQFQLMLIQPSSLKPKLRLKLKLLLNNKLAEPKLLPLRHIVRSHGGSGAAACLARWRPAAPSRRQGGAGAE